jgi:hypothetical protein
MKIILEIHTEQMNGIDKVVHIEHNHRKKPMMKKYGIKRYFYQITVLKNITFKPKSTKSKTHISKNNVSVIAKRINKHPVETFRNVEREKVIILRMLPIKPSKNVIK